MKAIPTYSLIMLADVKYHGDLRLAAASGDKCRLSNWEFVNLPHLSDGFTMRGAVSSGPSSLAEPAP